MCRLAATPTTSKSATAGGGVVDGCSTTNETATTSSSSFSVSSSLLSSSLTWMKFLVRPQLPVWLVLACIPFLPSYCFINRGYTQWFLWGAILYKLTHHPYLPPFLAIQGLLITVGWYMTLTLDYIHNGRFLHILIRNMPECLTVPHVINGPNVTGQDIQVHTTIPSLIGQFLCIILDTAIHPLLCYYFWYTCWNTNQPQTTTTTTTTPTTPTHKNNNNNKNNSTTDIASWTNIIAAVLLSKVWSIIHCWIHYETLGLFYYGNHVYTVPANADHLWTAAYVGEATAIVLLRLYCYYRNTNSGKGLEAKYAIENYH